MRHEAQRGDVTPALLHAQEQDAQEENRAGDDGDAGDGAVKAPHDLKRARRADGDVGRPVGPEPEGRGVDARQGRVGRRATGAAHRKPIDAVAGVGEALQL